jgi:hypothetical protein
MKTLNLVAAIAVSIFCFSGCKLDKPDFSNVITNSSSTNTTSGGNSWGNITAPYYFKGTLGGQSILWQVDPNSYNVDYAVGSASSISNDKGNESGALIATISAGQTMQPEFGVEFRTFQVNTSQDIHAYFNTFVNTGAWAFATSTSDLSSNAKTIVIDYTDAKGNQYWSVGPQTGNSITVVSVTQIPAGLGVNESLKIKLTFSCKLYPVTGSGNAITLSNVEATLRLEDMLY